VSVTQAEWDEENAMKMIRNTLDLFELDAEDEVVDEEVSP